MAELKELVEHLDGYLRVAEIEDFPGAVNGLQVENRAPVEKVAAATDACQASIDHAARAGAQLLLVHHGLFWGDPRPVTGPVYRRIRALVESDIALYSAHLPLDIHPEVGNNVLLAAALNLDVEGRFGNFRSVEGLGVWSAADLPRSELVGRLREACGTEPYLIAGGPAHVRRVGIVSGGAGSMIEQAHREGLDTFITGEGAHDTFHQATELGLNVIYAGHYATETFGVRALARELGGRFGLEWEFLDHPTGL